MITGTRSKCVGHLPAQGINFWVIPGQDQASRSAQNQKNDLFFEGPSGEASLNRACTRPSYHSVRRTKVLKCKTFYDGLEMSVFPPDVTALELMERRHLAA